MTKPICIRVYTHILDKIRLIAEKEDRSVNYIINQMILKSLGEE